MAALTAFYASRASPLWIKDGALAVTAVAVIDELKKAGDWGLEASAFDVPDLASGASSDAQGEADVLLPTLRQLVELCPEGERMSLLRALLPAFGVAEADVISPRAGT